MRRKRQRWEPSAGPPLVVPATGVSGAKHQLLEQAGAFCPQPLEWEQCVLPHQLLEGLARLRWAWAPHWQPEWGHRPQTMHLVPAAGHANVHIFPKMVRIYFLANPKLDQLVNSRALGPGWGICWASVHLLYMWWMCECGVHEGQVWVLVLYVCSKLQAGPAGKEEICEVGKGTSIQVGFLG